MGEVLASSYDLIVIGAGPAGSSAARAAAQRGAKVLLIDQRQRIGLPVQCAELISKWISHHAPFIFGSIIQSLETMVIHLPDRTTFKMKGH
jgi:flavin-dependent dehydrogenase